MRGRYKSWTPGFIDAHPEVSPRALDAADPFYRGDLVLEIGSGKGGFLLSLAALHPSKHFLGLERDVSCCGTAVKEAVEEERENIRFLNLDFDDCFEELAKLRFDEIHVNFPDPWPKLRHAKRRLFYPERLKRILSLLSKNGRLEIRTDNDDLYDYLLASYEEAGACILPPPYPEEECESEYEQRFKAMGKDIHRAFLAKKGK